MNDISLAQDFSLPARQAMTDVKERTERYVTEQMEEANTAGSEKDKPKP